MHLTATIAPLEELEPRYLLHVRSGRRPLFHLLAPASLSRRVSSTGGFAANDCQHSITHATEHCQNMSTIIRSVQSVWSARLPYLFCIPMSPDLGHLVWCCRPFYLPMDLTTVLPVPILFFDVLGFFCLQVCSTYCEFHGFFYYALEWGRECW